MIVIEHNESKSVAGVGDNNENVIPDTLGFKDETQTSRAGQKDGQEAIRKVLGRLQLQCSKREYCESMVREKAMKALDYNREAADKVVESLVREKYVDNRRYASAFAREKSAIAGWGCTKIAYMLRAKGISQEDISAGLEEIDREKSISKMEKVLLTKYKTLKTDPAWKQKLLRFGMGRGWDYESLLSFINGIGKDS